MKLDDAIDLSEMCMKCDTMEIVHDRDLWMFINKWLKELRMLREGVLLLSDAFPAGEYKLTTRQFIELNNMEDQASRIRHEIVEVEK